MTQQEIKIAKRIEVYMSSIAEQQIDLNFFMGLGFALAIVYEESTGYSAQNRKPKEIMEWARNLPLVTYPHVEKRTN
jgi:hypothetical protein